MLPIAAVIVAGLALITWKIGFTQNGSETEIATLIFAEECEWAQPGGGLEEGESLSAGNVRLQRGMAVLRFGSGAEMVLNGQVSLELQSVSSARLIGGEVVVRAEDGADGFHVETPRGGITDLGTEFAVRVDAKGETELHVHEGKVALKGEVVQAGNAVKLGTGKHAQSSPQIRIAPRYRELIERAAPKERRDLMTAYEGFFLPEGTYTPEKVVKGKGWASPWRLRDPAERGGHPPNSIQEMIIGHGQMTVPWPVRGGRLGMLQLPGGTAIWTREMNQPVAMKEDGLTYLSFLAAEESDPKREGSPSSFRITLRTSQDYFGESVSIGWSGERHLRLKTSSNQLTRSIRQIPHGETVFCVGKIKRSQNGSDRAQFRFYRVTDVLDFAEPAEWDVTLNGIDLNANLDLLLITSHGKTSRWVDEIRVGPTWRSVTPIASVE